MCIGRLGLLGHRSADRHIHADHDPDAVALRRNSAHHAVLVGHNQGYAAIQPQAAYGGAVQQLQQQLLRRSAQPVLRHEDHGILHPGQQMDHAGLFHHQRHDIQRGAACDTADRRRPGAPYTRVPQAAALHGFRHVPVYAGPCHRVKGTDCNHHHRQMAAVGRGDADTVHWRRVHARRHAVRQSVQQHQPSVDIYVEHHYGRRRPDLSRDTDIFLRIDHDADGVCGHQHPVARHLAMVRAPLRRHPHAPHTCRHRTAVLSHSRRNGRDGTRHLPHLQHIPLADSQNPDSRHAVHPADVVGQTAILREAVQFIRHGQI